MKTWDLCQWMVRLAKAGLLGAPVEGAAPAGADDQAWEELYDLAIEQGLIPLAQGGIEACGLTPPAAIAERFAKYARGSDLRAARASDQFRPITEEFAKAGIELIALKGMMFAFRHYSRPGLRRFRDIDILVRVEDLDRAGAAMEKLGYISVDADEADHPSFFLDNPYKYHSGYTLGEGYPVELHWDLMPKRAPVRFDLAGLWERSRESVDGARELAFEDEVVFQAVHMTRHEFLFPVRAFFDLQLLLAHNAGYDPEELWRHAQERGAAVDLAAALGVLAEIGLGDDLPPVLLARVSETVSASRLNVVDLARYVLTWPKFEYADRAIDVLSAPGPAAAVRRLGELLFPRYSSLVEREAKIEETSPEAVQTSYGALWRSRLAHWARKARNLPAETANLRTSVQMRRAFNNRTVREDE